MKRISRNHENSTAVLIDVRHLKNINEMFGYLAGDYVIKEVANLLKENTRGSDATGRFKGDKFIVILHQTDAHGTMQYINKFEASLQQIDFMFNDLGFDVELKYGVTMCKKDDTVDTLMQRASKALSRAKKSRTTDIEYLL